MEVDTPTTGAPAPIETPTITTSAAPETVSKADLDRALQDLHKFKSQAAKLKEQIDLEKTNQMKAQNQWKDVAEQREREVAEWKGKSEALQTSYLSEKKYQQLSNAAQKLGLRPEALSDLESLDLEEIQIETTSTGKINVLGAEKFAERLKALKPHWFQEKPAPNVNASGQRVQDPPATVTTALILQAQKEGEKSGDMSKYHGLVRQYQQQSRKH